VGGGTPKARVARLADVTDVPLRYVRPMSGGSAVVAVPTGIDLQDAARELEQSASVASAEPDYVALPAATPNDPYFPLQWHYGSSAAYGLGLPVAWNVTKGSSGVVVAVVDTGYRPHADFGARLLTAAGYDMITDPARANDTDGRDADATDAGDFCADDPESTSSWHGTHVAGTIGAATNNGVGVAGVDWRAKIVPVRVLGCEGGTFSDIIDGIRYAAGITVGGATNPNPADVINLSLGGYTGVAGCPAAMQSGIDDATAAGAIVVVAAGNDGWPAELYSPASCDNVIVVGATTAAGVAAYYSNFGPELDVSAPGGEVYRYGFDGPGPTGVLSLLNDGETGPGDDSYAYYQGTSMAAPHVAGVVSLMLAMKPDLTLAQVESILAAAAHRFGTGNDCAVLDCGAGIVDAGAALTRLKAMLLKVTAPNGGQRWTLGSRRTITWGATTPNSTVKIELLRPGRAPLTLAKAVASQGKRWTWTISRKLGVTGKAQIRVTRTLPGGSVVSDVSDKTFALVS
jgi:serine protease